jgi:hypothetical protein
MPISVDVSDRFEAVRSPQITVLDTELLSIEARMATALIEQWGLVIGTPDGEDSAGRQKFALMPIDEMVKRACDTAAAALATFRAWGWVTIVPTLDEARQVIAERRDREKENGGPQPGERHQPQSGL